MAEFNGLTKQQEDEMIERIMQDKPWEGFFNRAWFRFFRNHMLKITLLFYIPVMNKIVPEYSTVIMGILFILAIAIEYRTKRIEDKITDRQWVEVAVRGGVIGNPEKYMFLPNGWNRFKSALFHHKWIFGLNFLMPMLLFFCNYFNTINLYIEQISYVYLSLITIFYVSYSSANVLYNGLNYDFCNLGVMPILVAYTFNYNSILGKIIFIIIKLFVYLVIFSLCLVCVGAMTDAELSVSARYCAYFTGTILFFMALKSLLYYSSTLHNIRIYTNFLNSITLKGINL